MNRLEAFVSRRGYHVLERKPKDAKEGIIYVGCVAYVRRNFVKALKIV